MWEILVVHVGKLADERFREGAERYASMIGGEWRVRTDFVPASRRREPALCRRDEGEALLRRVPKESFPIALDQHGRRLTSEAFSDMLLSLKDSGKRPVFLVGGAHGLDRAVLAAARQTLSLSDMTFPHELATLVLMEQIYRAHARCTGRAYAK